MAFDSSQLTPDQPQRARLTGGLSKLIRQRGWERFVTGLFVEPTTAFFPDTIAPNIGGVRLLARTNPQKGAAFAAPLGGRRDVGH